MSIMDTTAITILTAGATTLLTKGAEAPAHTLNLVWKQVFGSFDLWLEKQQLKRKKELDDFSNRLNENLEKIPQEEIQEPKYSILGPAIEASQYYLEEEELREIFAKLVSASFDARNNGKIHNSFVEKVKSLSSHDARLLQLMKELKSIAIGVYYIEDNNTDGSYILSEIVCLVFGEQNIEKIAVSIDSLVQLGLVKIDLDNYFTDEKVYADFYTTNLFMDLSRNNLVTNRRLQVQKLLEKYPKDKIALDNNISTSDIENYLIEKKLKLKKGICELTSLGKIFVDICC
ncbi:DUF4393 domain-containing protein [Neisseria sp. HMSC068C04]|uniref:DUF4393 domain-containing protein n=1 Tax=Neisseria sp. HMSC068C04 TaxID=1715179 RepID=UPI0008A5D867|nr:DUF4393 domain-containing protein [Neisseria sp. HMSC068C04]OFM31936.1 hypothetical protein HMPREF2700_00320 [Neisseria sp. HMSC068C04]